MPIVTGSHENRTSRNVEQVLAGQSRALPISTALGLVTEVDLPRSRQEELVGNLLVSASDVSVRSASARVLGKLPTDGARRRLRDALSTERDGRVVAEIATSLGFVGEERDIELLKVMSGRTDHSLAVDRLHFAAGLIAYRLRLPGPDITRPANESRLVPTGETVVVTARNLTAQERSQALGALERQPMGFVTTPELIWSVQCGPQTFYIALNRDVSVALDELQTRKTVVGAVEILYSVHDQVSPAFLILSNPTEIGFELTVTRLTGEVLYAGAGTANSDRLRAHIWSTDVIGVPAIEITVTFDRSGLSLDGVSERVIRKKRQPRLIG